MARDSLTPPALLALALAAGAAGCAGAHVSADAIHDEADARRRLGSVVEFEGLAGDLKIAGAVVTKDLTLVCDNVDAWPPAMVGRSVKVRGRLEHRGGAAEAGARIEEQHVAGGYYFMERCAW
ncbi:MAG TPA: hypothetical protein VKZ18_02310 [Polyangia bacterium]|nr:hypothetical protein [Polyangia bacterium]